MKKVLIIGGLGFIGFNTALYLFKKKKYKITIIDNFTGASSKRNFFILKKNNVKIPVFKTNVKNFSKINELIKKINPVTIYNLSGQVAVTKSIQNPKQDFEDNLLSTFNILEAIRNYNKKIKLITVSSNKVYGDLKNLKIIEKKFQYESNKNINESFKLNFKTPYSCSKGAADQYVIDYAKIFGLNTLVLRLSCVYGPYQWGTEDQGWISWFIKRTIQKKPINIFGNGKQVRDVLFVNDLTNLLEICQNKMNRCSGDFFNIGGGESNKISILQLIQFLEKKLKMQIEVNFKKERKGDQKYFVNDLQKIKNKLGWKPKYNLNQGLEYFITWIKKNERI